MKKAGLIGLGAMGAGIAATLRAKGYTAEMGYLGSETKQFCVDTYYGSSQEPWTVNHLNYPPTGENGCMVWRKPKPKKE